MDRRDPEMLRDQITTLLNQQRNGDVEAERLLIDAVYGELHRIAQRLMANERWDHTLQPTVLVHDAFMELLARRKHGFQNRAHFFASAARAMRRMLVDHARGVRALKRGGGEDKLVLDHVQLGVQLNLDDVLLIDAALTRLAQWDLRQSRVVEMRFFGGLTEEEISEALNVDVRTVRRDWKVARAWLHGELSASDDTRVLE
jgi:RNA polymerase sigma-70 factor, ECF subfamily